MISSAKNNMHYPAEPPLRKEIIYGYPILFFKWYGIRFSFFMIKEKHT